MKEITGQTILITGGTQGVGKALADLFRAKGNRVIVLARHVKEDESHFICDAGDYKQVESTFQKIFYRYGTVDILINNVGQGLGGALEFIPYEAIERQIKTTLLSAVYCTKAFLRLTPADKKAKIIQIGSIGALGVQPFRTLYSVAKAGVEMFTVGIRQELYRTPVTVTSVILGDTRTDFGKHHDNYFATSSRYGDRIRKSEETSCERAKQPRKKDKRMPLDQAVKGIYKVVAKSRPSYGYCIGIKYKFLHVVSRFFTCDQISEIVRRLFEN